MNRSRKNGYSRTESTASYVSHVRVLQLYAVIWNCSFSVFPTSPTKPIPNQFFSAGYNEDSISRWMRSFGRVTAARSPTPPRPCPGCGSPSLAVRLMMTEHGVHYGITWSPTPPRLCPGCGSPSQWGYWWQNIVSNLTLHTATWTPHASMEINVI